MECSSAEDSLAVITEDVSIIPEASDFKDVHSVSLADNEALQVLVSTQQSTDKKDDDLKQNVHSQYILYNNSPSICIPEIIIHDPGDGSFKFADDLGLLNNIETNNILKKTCNPPLVIKSKLAKNIINTIDINSDDKQTMIEKRSNYFINEKSSDTLKSIKQEQDTYKSDVLDIPDEAEINLHLIDYTESQDKRKSNCAVSINQSWFTAKKEKLMMKQNGHAWKQGMWSKEETEQLEYNVNKYCKEHGIKDPNTIIFGMSKEQRSGFYRVIASGINRPLFSIYRRVLRLYDNRNHRGKYTPEEVKKLKKLRAEHGSNWQVIASMLDRSSASVKDRCRLLNDNCNKGGWTPQEEDRLAEVVYSLAKAIPGEQVTNGISWSKVAARVGSRSEKQCRTKWLNYLNWKHSSGVAWSKTDDIQLICRLSVCGMKDEANVDWMTLGKGWAACRSPHWLRGKWWDLKRKLTGCTEALSLREMCCVLYNNQNPNVIKSTLVNLPFTTACIGDKSRMNSSSQSNIKLCAPAANFKDIINATKSNDDDLNILLMELIRCATVVTEPESSLLNKHLPEHNTSIVKSIINKSKLSISSSSTSLVNSLQAEQKSLHDSLNDEFSFHSSHIESNISTQTHLSTRLLQDNIKEDSLSDCETSVNTLNRVLDSSSSQVILNDPILSVSNELLGNEEVLP